MNNLFVSIHIPRAAGTMLGTLFDFCSGRRVFFDYGDGYANARNLEPDVFANADFIARRFAFIHGHFFHAKYDGVFADAKFITCIRHPVERLLSQFRAEVRDALLTGPGPRAGAILSGEMDFVDYAQSDLNFARFLSLHLEGRSIEAYDFVILFEHLGQDIERFFKAFGLRRQDPWSDGLPPLRGDACALLRNSGLMERFDSLTAVGRDQLEKVFSLMPEDVELYIRAVLHRERQVGKSRPVLARLSA